MSGYEPWARLDLATRMVLALATAAEDSVGDMTDLGADREREALLALVDAVRRAVDVVADAYDDLPDEDGAG